MGSGKEKGDLWVWEKSVLPLHSRECEGLKVGCEDYGRGVKCRHICRWLKICKRLQSDCVLHW